MEQRKSDRLELKIFVDHILGEDERCVCVCENLSAGGMMLRGSPGKGWGRPRHVWLQFKLRDQKVRALGELRYERTSESGAHLRGYRFKYMSPRERCAYNQFLDQQRLEQAQNGAA